MDEMFYFSANSTKKLWQIAHYAYLRITKPYSMSPSVYDYPFKDGVRLDGPYLYIGGKYYWDRDT